jgi:hypothetical protein
LIEQRLGKCAPSLFSNSALFSDTELKHSDVPPPKLSSALAVGTDVGATITARVALGSAIFAGLHVVYEAPNVAAEIFTREQGLVVTAHMIDHCVDIFTGRTTPELFAGKIASAVQLKVHEGHITCAMGRKVNANEVGDVGELLWLARHRVAVSIREGEYT